MATKYLVEHIIISSLSQLETVHHSLLNVPRISMCAIHIKSVCIDEMITMTPSTNWVLVGAILERTPRVKFLQVHPHPILVPTLEHHAGFAIRRLQIRVCGPISRVVHKWLTGRNATGRNAFNMTSAYADKLQVLEHPLTGTDAFKLISACADKLQVLILNLDAAPFDRNSEDIHERQLFLPELHTLSVVGTRQRDLVLIAPTWRLPKLAHLDGAEMLTRRGARHLFSSSNSGNAPLPTHSMQALTLLSRFLSQWLPAFDLRHVEDVVFDRRSDDLWGFHRAFDYSEYRTCQRMALRYGVNVYRGPDRLVLDIDFDHCGDILWTIVKIFPLSKAADRSVCVLEDLKVIRILMTRDREAPDIENEIPSDAVASFTKFTERVFWMHWELKLRAAGIVLEAAWDNGQVVKLGFAETSWSEEVVHKNYEKHWGFDDEDFTDYSDEEDYDDGDMDMRLLENWDHAPWR